MFCYFSQVPKLNLSYDIFHTTSVSYIHVQVSTRSAYVKVGYGQKHVGSGWDNCLAGKSIRTFHEKVEPLETEQAAAEVSGCTLRLKSGLHPHGKCSHTSEKGRRQFRRSLYSLGKHIMWRIYLAGSTTKMHMSFVFSGNCTRNYIMRTLTLKIMWVSPDADVKVLNNTLYILFNVFWSKLWNISATNYLYHGHSASYGDIKLDQVEARELLKNHQYFLSMSNIVSLSYHSEKREGEETGRYVLHVGVIEKLPAEEIKRTRCPTAQGCHIWNTHQESGYTSTGCWRGPRLLYVLPRVDSTQLIWKREVRVHLELTLHTWTRDSIACWVQHMALHMLIVPTSERRLTSRVTLVRIISQ